MTTRKRSDGKHYVYILKARLSVRIDNAEIPVYKIGESSNVIERKYDYMVPFGMDLLDYVELPDRETALLVERFLVEYFYPEQRLRGTRNSHNTEWLYLTQHQISIIRENLSQFEDATIAAQFLRDKDEITKELNGYATARKAMRNQYDLRATRNTRYSQMQFVMDL